VSRYAALAAVLYEDDEDDEDEFEMGQEGVVLFLRGRNGGYRRFEAGEMHAAGLGPASPEHGGLDDAPASSSLH